MTVTIAAEVNSLDSKGIMDPEISEPQWWGAVSRDEVDVLTTTSSRGKAEIKGA